MASEADEIFCYWREIIAHPRARFDAKRRRKVLNRLKDGYTVEEIKTAIDGNRRSGWHQRGNPGMVLYDDLELICRDAAHLERFIDLAQNGNGFSNQLQEAVQTVLRERPDLSTAVILAELGKRDRE